jgi:hypothetical protein
MAERRERPIADRRAADGGQAGTDEQAVDLARIEV